MSYLDDASLVMIPSGYKDGKLYSVKPSDGAGDFTFTRGSNLAATRVDENGLIEKGRENRLFHSNAITTAPWLNTNMSRTGGQAGYDGSNDAWKIESLGGNASIHQLYTGFTSVATYSVYVKAGSVNWIRMNLSGAGNEYFDIANGVVGTGGSNALMPTITSVGGGWYRCAITNVTGNFQSGAYVFTATADGTLSSASGDYVYVQDHQLEDGLVATDYIETGATTAQAGILEDMPRLDYSGGTCPALLLESQRTNIITQSEYFGAWSVIGSPTITTNYGTSPEGIQNSTRLEGVVGDRVFLGVTGASADYTYSIYAKGSGIIILRDNSGSYFLDISLNSEWTRYDYSFTASITNIQIQISSATADAEIWGAQFEAGSYPTSYIPTYGTSVTRGADAAYKTGISSLIGQTEGTLFLDFVYLTKTATNRFSLSDGTSQNWIFIGTPEQGESNASRFYIRTNNSVEVDVGASFYFALGQRYKLAIAYKSGDWAVYGNGTLLYSGSSTIQTVSAPLSELNFFTVTGGTCAASEDINQALLFKTRLSNAELATLTTL